MHRTIHEGVQLGEGPSENASSSFYGMRRASSAKLPPLPSLASGSGQGASRDASGSGRAGREWTGPGNVTRDVTSVTRGGRGAVAGDAGKSVGVGGGSTGAGRVEKVSPGSVTGVRIRRDSPAVPHVPLVPPVPILGSPPADPEKRRHGGSEVAGCGPALDTCEYIAFVRCYSSSLWVLGYGYAKLGHVSKTCVPKRRWPIA